jgi:hypothetical protein
MTHMPDTAHLLRDEGARISFRPRGADGRDHVRHREQQQEGGDHRRDDHRESRRWVDPHAWAYTRACAQVQLGVSIVDGDGCRWSTMATIIGMKTTVL